MSKMKIVAIGFMLFAMFFGAGNLIFPPAVGSLSGDNFRLAIAGFLITGVGLPFIGIIAGSFSSEGFISETRKIHPVFSVIYMLAVYMTIGPLFALPRTATVSYEIGVLPFFGEGLPKHYLLLGYSLIFFIVSLWLSYNPTKIVERIGQILTPLLLVTMIVLIVLSINKYQVPVHHIDEAYQKGAFAKGFTEGYQTMDTLAAVAFCIIVLKAVQSLGVKTHQQVFKYCLIAAVIAGIALAGIYFSLAWIGNHYPIDIVEHQKSGQNLGTYVLSKISQETTGSLGLVLLSVIVGLACLTTAVGLTVAISSYFRTLLPKVPYKVFVVIFTIISFSVANVGLEQIIQGAIPVLLVIYPITISLIMLIFIDRLVISLKRFGYQFPIAVVTVISILSVIYKYSKWQDLSWITDLPYAGMDLPWLLPLAVSLIIAIIMNATLLKNYNAKAII